MLKAYVERFRSAPPAPPEERQRPVSGPLPSWFTGDTVDATAAGGRVDTGADSELRISTASDSNVLSRAMAVIESSRRMFEAGVLSGRVAAAAAPTRVVQSSVPSEQGHASAVGSTDAGSQRPVDRSEQKPARISAVESWRKQAADGVGGADHDELQARSNHAFGLSDVHGADHAAAHPCKPVFSVPFSNGLPRDAPGRDGGAVAAGLRHAAVTPLATGASYATALPPTAPATAAAPPSQALALPTSRYPPEAASIELYPPSSDALQLEDPSVTIARLRRRLAAIDRQAAPLLAPYSPAFAKYLAQTGLAAVRDTRGKPPDVARLSEAAASERAEQQQLTPPHLERGDASEPRPRMQVASAVAGMPPPGPSDALSAEAHVVNLNGRPRESAAAAEADTPAAAPTPAGSPLNTLQRATDAVNSNDTILERQRAARPLLAAAEPPLQTAEETMSPATPSRRRADASVAAGSGGAFVSASSFLWDLSDDEGTGDASARSRRTQDREGSGAAGPAATAATRAELSPFTSSPSPARRAGQAETAASSYSAEAFSPPSRPRTTQVPQLPLPSASQSPSPAAGVQRSQVAPPRSPAGAMVGAEPDSLVNLSGLSPQSTAVWASAAHHSLPAVGPALAAGKRLEAAATAVAAPRLREEGVQAGTSHVDGSGVVAAHTRVQTTGAALYLQQHDMYVSAALGDAAAFNSAAFAALPSATAAAEHGLRAGQSGHWRDSHGAAALESTPVSAAPNATASRVRHTADSAAVSHGSPSCPHCHHHAVSSGPGSARETLNESHDAAAEGRERRRRHHSHRPHRHRHRDRGDHDWPVRDEGSLHHRDESAASRGRSSAEHALQRHPHHREGHRHSHSQHRPSLSREPQGNRRHRHHRRRAASTDSDTTSDFSESTASGRRRVDDGRRRQSRSRGARLQPEPAAAGPLGAVALAPAVPPPPPLFRIPPVAVRVQGGALLS